MPLTLQIITPERVVYSDTVDTVVLPTVQGEIGILPGHQPLLTMLAPGELDVTKAGQTQFLAVDKGFARVLGDTVSVLTEAAIDVAQIDPDAAAAAQARAEQALAEARLRKEVDPAELEKLEAVTRFAVAQQLVKRRHSF